MSTVLPAVNSAASVLPRSSVGGTLASSTADESQDRFLKLLVTQMRNQDPMNPMDNAQVTSQAPAKARAHPIRSITRFSDLIILASPVSPACPTPAPHRA